MAQTQPNAREHAARIVAPGEFRADSFRRKRIAPGVTLVLGKRPGSRTTETQSIRFDRAKWSESGARRWLGEHGYRAQSFEAANPIGPFWTVHRKREGVSFGPYWKATSEAEALDAYARDIGYRDFAHLESSTWDTKREDLIVRRIDPEEDDNPPAVAGNPSRQLDAARAALSTAGGELQRAAEFVSRAPDAPPGLTLKIAAAIAAHRDAWEGSFTGNPSAADDQAPMVGDDAPAAVAVAVAGTVDVPPEPNPRHLVQIGTARRVALTDGTGYRWNVDEAWPVLTEPGAEQLPAGRGRLVLVSPSGRSRLGGEARSGLAAETYRTWHDFDPRGAYQLDVPAPAEFERIGKARSIVYRSHKWAGKPIDYEHRFAEGSEPDVSIVGERSRPRAMMLRGGSFRVSSRGLVD